MDASKLIGRWDIVSWEQRYDDGRVVPPLGPELRGFLLYTAQGDMSVFIAQARRAPFGGGLQFGATSEEKAQAYSTVLSYAGRYVVSGDLVEHHVEVSLFPNWEGQVQKRRVSLDGDRLSITASIEQGTPEARVAALEWKKHQD
jgi:hypothetical protein